MSTQPNPFVPGAPMEQQQAPWQGQPQQGQPVMPNMGQPPVSAQPPMPSQGNAPQSGDQTFEVDLDDSASRIPMGYYHVRVVDCQQGVSSTGNPMITWSLVVITGDHVGFELKYWTVLTPSAMWKASEIIVALGLGEAGKKAVFNRSQALNRECGVYVEDQEYKGQLKSSVVSALTLSAMAEVMANARAASGGAVMPK